MADDKQQDSACDITTRPEIRLVLVGPAGNGKSATGNTILGKQVFREHLMATSPESQCQYAKTFNDGQNILVVDTPGLLFSEDSNEEELDSISREIAKAVLLSAPGPHAILLVIEMGRLSIFLQKAPRIIEDMFGVEAKRYLVIVLTGKDELEYEEETVEGYIANAPSYMSAMFKKFPVFAINNKSDTANKKMQTKELLKLVAKCNSVHMSNSLYKGIEEIVLRAEGESLL